MNKSPGGTTTRGGGNVKNPPARGSASSQRHAANVRPADFVRGVVLELRRVTWPTREEWIAATILTVALVVAVGVFTDAVDLVLGWLFSLLTGGTR